MISVLKWDSDFFGIVIANIPNEHIFEPRTLTEFADRNAVQFIQCLSKVDNLAFISHLENLNFHFADVKVTFEAPLVNSNDVDSLTICTHQDFINLKSMLNDLFIDSRYYGYEKLFPKSKLNEFYQTWVENAINKTFDDYCLIYKINHEIAGFVTVKEFDSIKKARIGLIGVSPLFQRKGIASLILRDLKSNLGKKGFNILEVSTQGKNYAAQNLYAKNGFRIVEMQSWYYWIK